MNLRALTPADMPAASALLAASDLPTDDLDDPSISSVGAFANASLVGVPAPGVRLISRPRTHGHDVQKRLERFAPPTSQRGACRLSYEGLMSGVPRPLSATGS